MINKQAYITESNGKYTVHSEKGRSFGTYKNLKKAKKRLQQIEMFKHMKGKRKMRKKAMLKYLLSL